MRSNIKRIIWVLIILLFAFVLRWTFEFVISRYQDQVNYAAIWNVVVRIVITTGVILVWTGIVIRSSSTANKLPWLILLALEPALGLTLFLTFGRSFRRSERFRELPLLDDGKYLTKEPLTQFEREIYRNIDTEITDIYKASYHATKHHAYVNDSSVSVLTNGEEFFPTLIHELEQAQEFILMQFYILRTDIIGKTILDILKQKAQSGVDVYLMYDAFGGVFLNRRYMKSLKKSGIKVVVNDPVYFGIYNTRINYRNHRKITVIDSRVGFMGGINLGDEYYTKRYKKTGVWRDTQLMFKGKVINSLTQLFFRDWYYNTEELISEDKYYKATVVKEEGMIQIVPSGPDFVHPPIRNMYVKMINNAKISIKIMTPYIALDQEMLTSLVIAANSGVQVDVIIPGKPDKKSIYMVTKSFIRDLLEANINVYTYDEGFTHAKVFIIDDQLASCGTYNLDNRSARINFEVTALLYTQGVEKLVEDFDKDLKVSTKIEKESWKQRGNIIRFIEGLFNLFSPIV
jgi:cardiolipin synthase